MQYLTSLITTVAVGFGSIFGLVPQSQITQSVIPLEQKISHLEELISKTQDSVNDQEQKLGSYAVSGGGTYRLKSSVGISDTTINLSSFKEPVSNIPYTMLYLATNIGYGTIEPNTFGNSEFISFTGITQNSDGSAQLTGVTKGLLRSPGTSACTASSTLSLRHPAQSIFIYTSDSPCHFSQYAVKQNNEVITGEWSGITPTASADYATKGYVDGISVGSITSASTTVSATAGETVTAGQVLFLKQADARWYKASISIPEASTTILGIAQGGGTAGVAIAGGVLVAGLDNNQSGLTAGTNYFLSSTAGTLGTATTTRIIGRARTTTSIYFNTSSLIEGIKNTNNTFTGTNIFNGITIASTSVTVFNGSGTWTKSTQGNSGTIALIEAWGGGGGGGARASVSASGGGGGGYNYRFVPISLLGSTETVTVGAGGTSGNGSTIGGIGATSTFGTWVSAYGGGGGSLDSSTDTCGGGGGGAVGSGSLGGIVQTGGNKSGLGSFGGQSGDGACGADNATSTYNGAGGGAGIGTSAGGGSVWGGAGGGGAAAGSGAGGTSVNGGNGGAGNTAGSGVAGSQPGGGGGASLSGTGGVGGAGRVRITIF